MQISFENNLPVRKIDIKSAWQVNFAHCLRKTFFFMSIFSRYRNLYIRKKQNISLVFSSRRVNR
jgi:hypothetical protein